MKQEVLRNWDMPWLPVTALVIFVVCFAAYIWWTYRRENKSFYDAAALIPLDEKEKKYE